jgi:hypothetical protein|tara:strand:- start:331 stop:552 length:222 start_codon:yes stop_codon:yes gene_type:complete
MNISKEFTTAFELAVNNAENIQRNGYISWNFVDADVYMDMHQLHSSTPDSEHYAKFERLASEYEAKHGVQLQL